MNSALLALLGARAAATSTFNPATLSSLGLWLDASDSATIAESGGLVSQWADKSGAGNHVSQNTDANKPTYDATKLGGRGAVYFGASAQRGLKTAGNFGLITASSLTVHAVIVRRAALVTYSTICGQMQASPVVWGGIAVNFPTANAGGMSTDVYQPAGTTSGASGATTLDASTVATWVVSPVSNAQTAASTRLRLNGAELTPTAYGNATPAISLSDAPLTVGNWVLSRTDTGWPGDICELIVRRAAATTQEITDTETYLKTKWGIA